jgi:hypothetical protein
MHKNQKYFIPVALSSLLLFSNWNSHVSDRVNATKPDKMENNSVQKKAIGNKENVLPKVWINSLTVDLEHCINRKTGHKTNKIKSMSVRAEIGALEPMDEPKTFYAIIKSTKGLVISPRVLYSKINEEVKCYSSCQKIKITEKNQVVEFNILPGTRMTRKDIAKIEVYMESSGLICLYEIKSN